MMISLVATALIFGACSGVHNSIAASTTEMTNVKPLISPESLGLRKSSLTSEEGVDSLPVTYSTAPAGTSTKIERAYQDAPPMIPHDVSDYLPITKENNACISCHMPDVAASMGATPIPPTHFMDMRPSDKVVDGKVEPSVNSLNNQTSIKKLDHLYAGRYNCSQCHAPQATNKLACDNTFKANYIKKDGAYKSSWKDVMLNNLDTVGKDSNVTAEDIANKNSPAGHLKDATLIKE